MIGTIKRLIVGMFYIMLFMAPINFNTVSAGGGGSAVFDFNKTKEQLMRAPNDPALKEQYIKEYRDKYNADPSEYPDGTSIKATRATTDIPANPNALKPIPSQPAIIEELKPPSSVPNAPLPVTPTPTVTQTPPPPTTPTVTPTTPTPTSSVPKTDTSTPGVDKPKKDKLHRGKKQGEFQGKKQQRHKKWNENRSRRMDSRDENRGRREHHKQDAQEYYYQRGR